MKNKVHIFLLKRRYVLALALLAISAAIFYAVNYPAAQAAYATDRQLPIYCVDCGEDKRCAISFDAAWGNEDTQTLIDILARYNVKTTFFVVGDWAEKYPESVRALHEAGHEVMSHSLHHDHYSSLSAEQIVADVQDSCAKIEAVTGECPTLIRCPYGEYDDHVISAIRSIDMEPIQWSVEQGETASSPVVATVCGLLDCSTSNKNMTFLWTVPCGYLVRRKVNFFEEYIGMFASIP